MSTSLGGGIGQIVSFKAAADYSDEQYYPVKLSAANTIATCSAVTDAVIGILQNKPEAAGAPSDVLLINGGGVSKVVCSGTIAAAGLVYVGSDGLGRAPLSADNANVTVLGYAIEAAGASGDIISILVNGNLGTIGS